MHTVQVLTVSPLLPQRMLDDLLTRTEETLIAHGAQRIWVDTDQPSLAVVAEFAAAAWAWPAAALT
ncbi:hypothetical protein [Nocardioides sp. YIM 152315]|uniref:hypothetical protein n=1 Tax=Nocardioides sp. YIM 152315 TaxID=3031760 RepID=UPI0023DCE53B|nr:hypothetical protein [Nocardioides sp. YIM 152315]MDF1606236.1 hypothetical protein [Nocardioides sp. YIM 152315]